MAPSLGLLVLAVPTRTCDVGCILSEEGRKDSAGSTCQGLSSSAQRSSLPRCPMGDSPHASWLSSAKGLGRGMFLDSTAIILCEERALWPNAKHWHKPSYVDAFVCLPACSATSVVFNPASLWPVARQPPLSMGFSRQECWSGLPCSPLGALPDPGIEPTPPAAPALQAGSLPLSHCVYCRSFQSL